MKDNNNTASLGWGTRAAYGLGDTACNVVFGMITALLTLFYTDYCGISVVTVGMVMLISRFDGSSDVIMGIIVGKTKSKWGKARPWILWMSVPYVLCAVAMFCVPHTSSTTIQFWYIFVTYNLCTTVCYTAINVPYGTLSTMMTRSSHERDLLSIVRMALSPVGKIIAVTFTMPVVKLFGDNQAAWIKTMSMWCAIALILLIICFVRCKETVNFEAAQQEQPKVPASRALKALLGNPYFWATLVLWTVTCVHTTIIGTDLPYYCKYVLGNDSWYYSVIYTAEIVTLIVGALLCPLLLQKFNKRDLSLAGCIIVVIAHALIMVNPMSFQWVLVMTIIRSLGQAPLTSLVFGMMGDVVEYGQWKSHLRQESLIFGGGSLGFKIGTGITSAVMTAMLEGAGFLSSVTGGAMQPTSAQHMISSIFKFGPIFVWAAAIIVLLFYKLDKIYPTIAKELAEREARGEM